MNISKKIFKIILCSILVPVSWQSIYAYQPRTFPASHIDVEQSVYAYQPRTFPALHINAEQSPFLDRDLSQEGTISLTNVAQEFYFIDIEAQVRGRGNSTWRYGPTKRPLRFRLNEAKSIMGSQTIAKEWILLANQFDKSLLRNYAALYLARQLGNMDFAQKTQNVHLYVNGEYMGVYLLTDERNTEFGRVSVTAHPNPGQSGFFIEMGSWSWPSVAVKGIDYEIRYPRYPFLTNTHIEYVRNFIYRTKEILYTGNFEIISQVIDINSFIDFYIVAELFKCLDTIGHRSNFMYICGRNDFRRLYMGPVWDFDLSAGGTMYVDDEQGLLMAVYNQWYRALMKVPEFREAVVNRWNEVRSNEISQTLDRLYYLSVNYQTEFERNFQRHDILGSPAAVMNGNPDWFVESLRVRDITTFRGQADYLISWLETRADWLDDYFNQNEKGKLENFLPVILAVTLYRLRDASCPVIPIYLIYSPHLPEYE